ncbi:MAG: tautomerase [Chloroflexota bacterium]
MPYLQLDLSGTYPPETKQRLARKLGDLYCEIMQARAGIVHVAFRELGGGNLYRTGLTEPVAAGFIMCDIRSGRPPEQRFALAQAIVAACDAELGTPEGGYTVEFTQHTGDEIVRDGKLSPEWSPDERG